MDPKERAVRDLCDGRARLDGAAIPAPREERSFGLRVHIEPDAADFYGISKF